MPKRPSQLAKLTRPRLHKAVARERLFNLLDEKREHAVVWIVGPPGAGKTTLVASYLEEAGVPAIWYQIDSGDSDPATFFYYLKQAVDPVSQGKSKSLPLLIPEYLSDLPAFARRFLRDAFVRLPDDLVFVFDNYHEVADGSSLHAAFKAALMEVPPGANIIVVSRADPPAVFVELFVNQRIAVITWDDLRVTTEETTAIAASRGIAEGSALLALHAQSGGWMAGVTLMLERLRDGEALEKLHRTEALDTVFEYFAGLIFDNASEQMRHVLMKTAYLPWVNSTLADLVTGIPQAIRHVEELHRRHLFTDRRSGEEITYQYHALFRAFLRNKAGTDLSAEVRRSLVERAAIELYGRGKSDEAFALFLEAEEWQMAEQIIIASASQLVEQGRWQTLAQWIEALPKDRLEASAWLRYWLGRAKTLINSVAARPVLEAAYRTFGETGDEIGQLLCATTILESFYFEFDDVRPMDPWIARVVGLLQKKVRPPTKEDELRANLVVMIGIVFRAPRHAMLESCFKRVVELLREPFDVNLKVAAASMLHAYSNVAMDSEAERIATIVARPLLESRQVTAPRALRYWYAEGYTHYIHGRYAEALACFDKADGIATKDAYLDVNSLYFRFHRGLCERRAGLLDEAEATIHWLERLPMPSDGHFGGGLDLLKAGVAFDRGHISSATESVVNSYKAFDKSGHFNGTMLVGTVAANMAIAGGRFDVAALILERLHDEEHGPIIDNYLAAIVLNQAWLAHRNGKIEARDNLLADTMRRACDARARVRLRWYTNAMSDLLPVALAKRINTDVARALAAEFAVAPSPSDVEEWPWPVKVYTLGRFELLIDGEHPEYSRKVPKRVLALLKAIVAFGGNDVPEQKLLDALWPDNEGDAARRSLTATLHRLRKLLVNGNAIRQAGGKLTLDNKYCWVDAVAFESRLDRECDDREAGSSAIPLYRGAFLAQEEDATWAVPMRERLRARFIQAVGKQCTSLEAARRYEQAIGLYLRGIEADSLIELFYQGLMRCYDKLDRRTEAVSAYRRLRQTLSVTLGVPPSIESQRLFAALRTN
jgi:LuxR family maltose regulon positive regulatory protein